MESSFVGTAELRWVESSGALHALDWADPTKKAGSLGHGHVHVHGGIQGLVQRE